MKPGEHMQKFLTDIMPEVPSFRRSGRITLSWEQKLTMERAYMEIGGEPIDKTCPSCITETMQRLLAYIKHNNIR